MYRVFLSTETIEYLSTYFDKYRDYYEKIYQDSWIWSENQIIDSYYNESKMRKQEIFDLLKNTLKEEKVLWKTPSNTIVIKWRTKYLIVEWSEDDISKKRIIDKVDIR